MHTLLSLYQTLLQWHEAIALAHEDNHLPLSPEAQIQMNTYARVLRHLNTLLQADLIALQHHFEPAPPSAPEESTTI